MLLFNHQYSQTLVRVERLDSSQGCEISTHSQLTYKERGKNSTSKSERVLWKKKKKTFIHINTKASTSLPTVAVEGSL